MTKRMLVDATHAEETRVAVADGQRLVEFDYESEYRKALKGSIFLAKVTRVEPSLQAAFVNFGGNRHGFLPFSEIHPDYFRIPIADREALLAEQQAAMEADEAEDDEEDRQPAEGHEISPLSSDQDSSEAEIGGREEDYVIEEIGGERLQTDQDSIDEDQAGSDDLIENDTGGFGLNVLPAEVAYTGNDLGDADSDLDEPNGNHFPEAGQNADLEEAGQPSDGSDPSSGPDEVQGERGRGGRHNNNARGRGRRGRHRVASSSRRTESFGGTDEYSQEDRFRYALRRKYKIQEVIKRGQIMLVQVSKEERGNKGAAVSTYLSLPGRYCVLMPNSPRGGGVSRKIANYEERARMREILKDLTVPMGMSVIVRTAGVSRTKPEVKRDLDYLVKLWNTIRELTLQSSAPALVYEEADLIKRAIRDLYDRDIEEVLVAGEEGFKTARNFMKMMIPTHVKRVVEYTDEKVPLFTRHGIEDQISDIGETRVNLPSGGYLIINPTEALVSVDVNSGKATKERHIEETALKTNMEAATELARQLRLRDLGGLIVIDFIDMEDRRNNGKVERRMRESLSSDRARLQMGRISSFGLMELSRQRLNPSLTESQFEKCTHCDGMGRVRTSDATSIMLLRAIEAHGVKGGAAQIVAHVSPDVALYILNHKRDTLNKIEQRHGLKVFIRVEDSVGVSNYRLDVMKPTPVDAGDDESDSETGSGRPPRDAEAEPKRERPERNRDRGERPQRERSERSERPEREERPERSDRAERDGQDGERGRRRGRRGGRRRNGRREESEAPVQPENQRQQDFQDNFADTASADHSPAPKSDAAARPRRERDGNRDPNRERPNKHPRRERGDRPLPEAGNDPGSSESNDQPRPRAAPATARTDPSSSAQSAAQEPTRKETPRPARTTEPKEYEKVNEAPSEKKRGWWNRLVEN